jgi:hypothetical protein
MNDKWRQTVKPFIKALVFASSITTPITAQAESITLNLYALGIRAGTIQINGAENSKSYALNGVLTSSVLLKLIRDIGFNGTASGKVRNGRYQSKKYSGRARTGSSSSVVQMHWNGSTPVLDTYKPGREKRSYDINPSKQKGTVDLLTGAYSTFTARPIDKLCDTTQHMFDGRRRTLIKLDKARISGKIATCTGVYKRVAGFSPGKMQKRVNFPFTMRYEQQNDGLYHFKDFTADATFGKIRAIRK